MKSCRFRYTHRKHVTGPKTSTMICGQMLPRMVKGRLNKVAKIENTFLSRQQNIFTIIHLTAWFTFFETSQHKPADKLRILCENSGLKVQK